MNAWMHGWGTYSRIPEVHVGSVAHGHVSRRDAVVVGTADKLAGMVHLSKLAVGLFFISSRVRTRVRRPIGAALMGFGVLKLIDGSRLLFDQCP